MDFALLQIFKAVAEERGITAAARKLHRVPSNVTTRIKQLEAQVGAALFIRRRGRLTLSPEGTVFLDYAEQMLRSYTEAKRAVAGTAPAGTLRLGTLESTATSRLPPLLARYLVKHPAVRLELTKGTADALIDALLARRIDAAFVADGASSPRIAMQPAFEEELVLIAAKAHVPIRGPRDARGDTIISFPRCCAYRRRLQAWLAAGSVLAERVLELSSYPAIVACVAAGAGIALTPRSVLNTIDAGQRVAVYRFGAKRRTSTSLAWRKDDVTAAIRALQLELEEVSPAARAPSARVRAGKR